MMADEFYIRRGSKVVGPATSQQLQQNLQSGKVQPTDEVAPSADGPWRSIADALSEAKAEAPIEPALASVDAAPAATAQAATGEVSASVGQGTHTAASSYYDAIETTVGETLVRIDGRPSFAHLRIDLGPGETIVAEADAMASMAGDLDMNAKLNGGFFSALKKRFLGGESLFVNHFTNNADKPLPLVLAPGTPGDIKQMNLSGEAFCLQPGAYIASTPGVKLGTRWAGFASLIGREGLFKLQVSGEGVVWYGAYGSLVEKEIDGEYIVDTGHLVGYEPHMKLKVQLAGGIFSSFFGGEGLVTRVEGAGKIIIQTRSLGGLASWLNPFLPA